MSNGIPYVFAIGVVRIDLLTIPAVFVISPNTETFIASTVIADKLPDVLNDIDLTVDKEDMVDGKLADNI